MCKGILFVLVGLLFNLSAWAQVNLNQRIFSDDSYILNNRASFSQELLYLSQKLPVGFVKRLPLIKIRVMPNTSHQRLSAYDMCGKSDQQHVLGQYDYNKKVLYVHKALLQVLFVGGDGLIADCAPHKTLYKTAQATIVHELMHAFETHNKNYTLSKSAQYIYMAEYDKDFWGRYENRNIDGQRLPDHYEKASPQEHLAVNFEYFILDETYSCRRPSFYNYFTRTFAYFPRQNCNKQTKVYLESGDNIQVYDLKYENVKRIDYVFATRGAGIVSGFGHSLFRIVICDKDAQPIEGPGGIRLAPDCEKDEVRHLYLSFAANIDDYSLDYMKGVFGGYPSVLSLHSFSAIKEDYLETQLRDLEIYPLKFSEKQKRLFVDMTLEKYWQYSGDYRFFGNNCATESFHLVQSVLLDSYVYLDPSMVERPYGVYKKLNEKGLVAQHLKYTLEHKGELYQSALNNLYGNKIDLEDYVKLTAQERRRKFQTSSANKGMKEMVSFKALEDIIYRQKSAEVIGAIYKRVVNKQPLKYKYRAEDLLALSFKNHAHGGYGIPLVEEAEFDILQFRRSKVRAYNLIYGNFELFPEMEREIKGIQENKKFIKKAIANKNAGLQIH